MESRAGLRSKGFLALVALVVGANYLAQVPYYLHLYYFPHGALPNARGSLLLGLTLAWFVAGLVLLWRGRTLGYWLLASFLFTEVAFYIHNIAIRVLNGYPALMDLQTHDTLLWTVFLIGYINMLVGLYFLTYLAINRQELTHPPLSASLGA